MQGMTLKEYAEILQYIKEHHRFGEIVGKGHHKHIKYVDSCFDMRTLEVWRVTFRGMSKETSFSTTDNPRSKERLYDVVLKWLSE